MDWMKQSQEMMESWVDAQKKMWEDWAAAAPGFGKVEGNPLGDWVARWQETMQQSMDVWDDLASKAGGPGGAWASAGDWPGSEEDAKKMAQIWMDQTTAVMKSWAEAQRALWDAWFEVANKTARSAQSPGSEWYDSWQAAARKSMDAWEDLSRKTMETQADWMKNSTKTAEKAAGKQSAQGASGKKK